MRNLPGLACVAAVLAMAGCTAAPDSNGTEHTDTHGMDGTHSGQGTHGGHGLGMVHVAIRGAQFDPRHAEATADGGVHFTNEDSGMHAVAVVDSSGAIVFDQTLGAGQAAHFEPPAPGAYHAFCRMHADMTANLQVH